MKFIQSARRTVTLSAFTADDDAIKASVSTDKDDPVVYVDVDFDGTLGGGPFDLPRTVTVTTDSSMATFNVTDPILVTGTDKNGTSFTEELLLTETNGGETVSSVRAFKTVTEIDVPVQLDDAGHFTFGVSDTSPGDEILEIRVKTAGTMHVAYEGGVEDTITALAGDRLPYSPLKIFADSTAQDVTLAFEN